MVNVWELWASMGISMGQIKENQLAGKPNVATCNRPIHPQTTHHPLGGIANFMNLKVE